MEYGADVVTGQLHLEPHTRQGDTLEVAGCLEVGGKRQRLWWRVPAEWESAITSWADPFVVGLLFPMMQAGGSFVVEGSVSPSLLKNLETYAAIWRAWCPERYQPLQISARQEVEMPQPRHPDQAVLPFSCGVDSCFSLLRHHRGLMGRRNRKIGAALVMHGFDIWLDQENSSAMYQGLLSDSRKMLASLDVPCIPVSSNFHELPTVWGDSFGTQLVSGLMLFSGSFGIGMIANSLPYDRLFPWGSSPVSDPFLGSDSFQLVDDGGECSRFEKIELLSQWPEARKHLRVCYSNPGNHANCCRCEKCIRTLLAFRIVGGPQPEAFARDVTNRQIRRVKFHHEIQRQLWMELMAGLPARGLEKTSWAKAMRSAARPHPWRAVRQKFIPLRNQVRKIFRGSTKGRRAIQEDRRIAEAAERARSV